MILKNLKKNMEMYLKYLEIQNSNIMIMRRKNTMSNGGTEAIYNKIQELNNERTRLLDEIDKLLTSNTLIPILKEEHRSIKVDSAIRIQEEIKILQEIYNRHSF